MRWKAILLLVLWPFGNSLASAQTSSPRMPSAPASSAAERLYAEARPRLLQIRTLVSAAGQRAAIGSGFLVTADGLAVTNYHVVSQFALEPSTYRLQYAAADGSTGELRLLAIDLPDDLAIVRLDHAAGSFFPFDDRAVTGKLPNGERLYSMGNPLDLGFTIVEGTYNGLVERSYSERIHFSGAINPGMSGGPAVTDDGRVAGVNVAKQIGAELVSFLVPARFVASLLKRAQALDPQQRPDFRTEIGRQLADWQMDLYGSFAEHGFRSTALGPYVAPESAAPWFSCWAQTNAEQVPKPRAAVNAVTCNSDTRLFVANDLSTGVIHISHSYLRSVDLNQFQFADFLSRQNQSGWVGGWGRRWYTPQRCHEDFMAASVSGKPLPLRAIWCARAYREFEGLYDVSVIAVTQNSGEEALMSRLSLQAVSYENAIALTKRFFEGVQWTK